MGVKLLLPQSRTPPLEKKNIKRVQVMPLQLRLPAVEKNEYESFMKSVSGLFAESKTSIVINSMWITATFQIHCCEIHAQMVNAILWGFNKFKIHAINFKIYNVGFQTLSTFDH